MELALSERSAALNLNPALSVLRSVVGADLLSKMTNNFPVAQQQQVVVSWQRPRDCREERAHVLVLVSLTRWSVLRGRMPRGAVARRDLRLDVLFPNRLVGPDHDRCGGG